MLTVECQTDCDSVTIISLLKEGAILKSELTRRPEFCVDSILKDDDKLTRFYTGMPTYQSFIAFVDYLQPKALKLTSWNGTHTKEAVIDESKQPGHQGISCLKVCDQLFAVLIRLRRGLDALDVCVRFSISEATYSRLFATWITFLSKELKMLFPFPSREQISQWMPPSFKKYFPNSRIIIDCYEIECQRPSGLMNSSITFSQYKSRNTWKLLVGCTPSGLVSFISEAWGGRISDQELTMQCGLLDLLDQGDMIMADKGFNIQELVAARGILVNVPPKLESKGKQMPAIDVEKTRRIAEFRIHIERIIGRGRRFEILNHKFPNLMHDLVSDINCICMFLTNFDNPLVEH